MRKCTVDDVLRHGQEVRASTSQLVLTKRENIFRLQNEPFCFFNPQLRSGSVVGVSDFNFQICNIRQSQPGDLTTPTRRGYSAKGNRVTNTGTDTVNK